MTERGEVEQVLRRYAGAWEAQDGETLLDCYHDDVVLNWFGDNPLAGRHVGRDAALTALFEQAARVRRTLVAIHDIIAGDGHGVILARERLERDDVTVECDRVLVYHVRDGKLAECWVYDQDQRAIDDLLCDDPPV